MFEQGQSGSSDRSTEFELANNEHWEPSRDSSAPDSSCPAVKKYRSTPPRANPPRPDILLLLLEKETERERDPSKSVARERKAGEKDSVSGGSRVGVLSRSKFRRRGNGKNGIWRVGPAKEGFWGGCKKGEEIVFLFSCL